MKVRIGAIAYNEEGFLGLVTAQTDVWLGIILAVGPEAGNLWMSHKPRVVGFIDQVAPPWTPLEFNLLRCATCERKMTLEEAKSFKHCPECGGGVAPEFVEQDILIRMNWAEARMLMNWAQAFALAVKLPASAYQRLARLARKFRLLRPHRSPALMDEEVQEEAQLSELEQNFAARAEEYNQTKVH